MKKYEKLMCTVWYLDQDVITTSALGKETNITYSWSGVDDNPWD